MRPTSSHQHGGNVKHRSAHKRVTNYTRNQYKQQAAQTSKPHERVANESRDSYYIRMNTIGIFFYIVSVVAWWAGFNYAAARASTTRRRKLFSTAAALALAWPFAFIALAAALATKAAASLMIAVGEHINNTWDAAVSDEGGTIVTTLTPMGTAVRVRRENTEHDTSAANNGYEDSDTSVATSEETSPALTDDTLLMPPPPPPATDTTDVDTSIQTDANDDAAETINKDGDDETITIQKVALSDLL